MFVDRANITVQSGKGGDGAVSFRREPYVPEGGPDGGDGGRGGDVIFLADRNLHTLMDFKYKRKYQAEAGQNGMRRKRFGKAGKDLVIRVPVGTLIIDKKTNGIMKDLSTDGQSFVVVKGGKGGKGNVHFKNSVRQAPNFAEAGGLSKERRLILELKLLADVGLVGFPNVGKSTLLSVTTKARPKIANYHFTTIDPNLGVAKVYDSSFVIADIAGIIEGAGKGAGLGLRFLKHIQRTKILIHVVDVSGLEGRDPIEDFQKINKELSVYSEKLTQKPQVVAANKMDLIDEKNPSYLKFKDYVENLDIKVFPISAVTQWGVKDLMNHVSKMLEETEVDTTDFTETFNFEEEEEKKEAEYREISARREGDIFILEGKQLLKIFNSTNFNDMGSLRYLYKYVEKNGGIRQLKELGLEEGDTISIEGFEFEYLDEANREEEEVRDSSENRQKKIYPGREECLSMLSEYGTPDHVIAHCKAVAQVAVTLAKRLNERGQELNLGLVEAAGLLHDIARTSTNHHKVGEEILRKKGYDDVADIVAVHMHYDCFNSEENINEADVVCLGDRVCKEGNYVGVEERMNYVMAKAEGNPKAVKIIEEKKKELMAYVKELEEYMGISLDDLMAHNPQEKTYL